MPEGGANGVIIAQGGRFGGWAVYAKDGKAKFVYNVLGIHEFATEADTPIPDGTHQVRMEFAYDGGGLAKGGDVTLYYDGNAGGRRPGRGHPADGLLRRRDHRHRLRVRHHRHPRLHRRAPAGSPARSTGSSSTSAPTTTTTSSTPRSASGSPWPGSRQDIAMRVLGIVVAGALVLDRLGRVRQRRGDAPSDLEAAQAKVEAKEKASRGRRGGLRGEVGGVLRVERDLHPGAGPVRRRTHPDRPDRG